MKHSLRKPCKLLENIAGLIIGTITRVSTQENVVALTFDDGPHPVSTPLLLDVLGKHGAASTFFMLGEAAQRYPEIVRRVARAGHAIGNHSWDHPSFPLISRKERLSQILACEKTINPYGQKLFRPPYGHQSLTSHFDAVCLGYKVIGWDLLALDWLDHDANWMVNQLVHNIKPGSIIVFHDNLYHMLEDQYADRRPTLEAVNLLVDRLGDCFSFVTIPELLRRGCPQRRNWYRKGDQDWLNSLKGQEGKPRRYV